MVQVGRSGHPVIFQHVYLRHQLPHFLVHITSVAVGYDVPGLERRHNPGYL
jgi:hypothetical protein